MAITFVGSYVGTHAATSAQTVAFSNLRDASGAQPTLQAGDLVLVAVENASTVDRTQAQLTPSGYQPAHTDNYQNDSNDSNLLVSYKFMGVTPDANVAIPASNATTAGVAYAIYVFRGVENGVTANGPFDVAPVVTGGTNTGVANAAAITPVTAGAWIVVVGGAAVAAGAVFTNPTGLSTTTNHFRSATITSTTNDANIGVGLKTDWTSGAFDPAAFGGSTSTNTGSWSAVTLALKPRAEFDVDSYRFRNDNGSETTATWLAAVNTDVTRAVSQTFRLRFLLQNTNSMAGGENYALQRRLNGGSWVTIPTTGGASDVAYQVASANYTNGTSTTQQIGAGSFSAGSMVEQATGGAATVTAGGETEFEWCLQLGSSAVIGGDIVEFRPIRRDGELPLDSYTRTATVTVDGADYDQDSFRFRNDNGTETTATWIAAANTNITRNIDQKFRLRFLLQNTDATAGTPSFKLQVNKNSGGWADVYIQPSTGYVGVMETSSNYANGDATTQQLGAGSFSAGKMIEQTQPTGTITVASGGETEVEFHLSLSSNQVKDGDTVQLRLVNRSGSVLASYTNTPTVTVAGPIMDQDSFRFRNDDGSETTATWKAATNTTPTLTRDQNFRVRFLIQNSGPVDKTLGQWPLYYRQEVSGVYGAWTLVTDTTPVRLALSSNFAHNAATTQQLGAGTFNAGHLREATGVGFATVGAGAESEFEYCLQLNSGQVALTDKIQLRVYQNPDEAFGNGVSDGGTYTNTPTIEFPATLVIANGTHAHASTSPTISSNASISIDAASHAHAATSPTIGSAAALVVQSGTHAHTATSPTIAAANAVAPDSASHAHAATSPNVTLTPVAIAPDAASHAHASTSPTIGSAATLVVASGAHAHTSTSPTIGTAATLVVQSGAHAHASTSPTIASKATLVVASGAHAHASTSPTIATANAVAPDSASHAHSATSPTITPKATLVVQSGAHDHVASSPTIGSAAALVVQSASHDHAATSPNVSVPTSSIAPDAATHAHTATSPTIASAAVLAVQAGTHAHVATSPTISAANAVSPDPGAHAHSATSPTVAFAAALVIQSGAHDHAASSPTISVGGLVAPDPGVHAHAATSPSITFAAVVAVQSGAHEHSSTSPAIAPAGAVQPADAVHSHASTSPTIATGAVLAVHGAISAHSATSPSIVSAGAVAPSAGLHGHSASEPGITPGIGLAIASAMHGHEATSPTIQSAAALVVADGSHAHAASQPVIATTNVLAIAAALHAHDASSPSVASRAVVSPADGLHAHEATSGSVVFHVELSVDSAFHAHLADNAYVAPPSTVPPTILTRAMERPFVSVAVARNYLTASYPPRELIAIGAGRDYIGMAPERPFVVSAGPRPVE